MIIDPDDVTTDQAPRIAREILTLAHALGPHAEKAIREAITKNRPDIQIGPGDPPDPG